VNKIILGDCLELMKGIEAKSIDMILCDLPYGTTKNKWDSIIPFEPLWGQYNRIIKDNGAIVLTASQPFTSALVMSNVSMFKYSWVWDKVSPTGWLNAKRQPMRKTEDVCIFGLGKTQYNPQGIKYNPRIKSRKSTSVGSFSYGKNNDENIAEWQGYPTNLIEFGRDKNKIHPTQKPVALFEYLIKTYTNEGELVLDNCSGSGTTAIACINTKRKFICIEKDPEYYDLSIKRMLKHRGL